LDAGFWRRLGPGVIAFVPAVVEEHEHGSDVMFVCDFEVLCDALFEALRVVLPREVMQKDAHAIEADVLCVAQFPVDSGGVEGGLLPHLQLIDGGRGDEVSAAEPSLCGVPGVCFFFGPDGARRYPAWHWGEAGQCEAKGE